MGQERLSNYSPEALAKYNRDELIPKGHNYKVSEAMVHEGRGIVGRNSYDELASDQKLRENNIEKFNEMRSEKARWNKFKKDNSRFFAPRNKSKIGWKFTPIEQLIPQDTTASNIKHELATIPSVAPEVEKEIINKASEVNVNKLTTPTTPTNPTTPSGIKPQNTGSNLNPTNHKPNFNTSSSSLTKAKSAKGLSRAGKAGLIGAGVAGAGLLGYGLYESTRNDE